MNIYDKIILTNTILGLVSFWLLTQLVTKREFERNKSLWTYIYSFWMILSSCIFIGWGISFVWRFL